MDTSGTGTSMIAGISDEQPIRRAQRRQRRCDESIVDLKTDSREVVTPKVLAAYEDCDVRTIIKMLEHGPLQGYRLGREWRVFVSSARAAFSPKKHT